MRNVPIQITSTFKAVISTTPCNKDDMTTEILLYSETFVSLPLPSFCNNTSSQK